MKIVLIVVAIIFLVVLYNKYYIHLSNIAKFNKLIETEKQKYITDEKIAELQKEFSKTYTFFSNQLVKNTLVNNFIYTYINLFLLKEQWNKEFLEIEQIKTNYPNNFEKANDFINKIHEFKKSYFTIKNRDNLINEYHDIYKYFSSDIFLKLNLQPHDEFIDIYLNLNKLIVSWNFEFVKNELNTYAEFFNNIDEKSLDYQQRTAVVTDDMNNLILAGAGSGKTLTIAAKVKYLVECKNINPNEILLISFTKKAADEMTERISTKLNIPLSAVTFHKLGLELLKNFNNPNILEDSNKIISNYFKTNILDDYSAIKNMLEFFLYYLNIPRDIESFETFGDYIESQRASDFETLKSKYNNALLNSRINDMKIELQTINGEKVRSTEEVMIANFLFMNGINYEYEREYPFKSETSSKKYHPDFYLTDYDIYLEHFGITEDNKVPWLSEIEEKKYLEEMAWKRSFHLQNGTKLIETYSYYNKEKRLLNELKSLLEKNNISLKPINIQDVYNKVYAQNQDYHFKEFEKLISTFIQLYKANGYTVDDLAKLKIQSNDYTAKRNNAFLEIIEPILIYYENNLKNLNSIDFNDMINLATKYLNENEINLSYKYIIIDEYQDISVGRYKLIKALINKTNAKLICVGDDWQSIYRFSGSDLDLFSKFENYFGETTILKIEKTYRNSQELLDIATKFIEKNPEQLKKNLVSDKRVNNPIMVMAYSENKKLALQNAITDIYMYFGEEAEILLLGRTKYDINDFVDDNIKYYPSGKVFYNKYPKMNIRFLTVHSSKGLEADNVIILNMENDLLGFPNEISDDPVLSLVLQNKDEYEFAEERRLFYVAITRTKNKTYLIAPDKHYSIFLEDLKKITNLSTYLNKNEDTVSSNPNCPRCKKGYLIIREKNKKTFLGCSNYPYCNYTLKDTNVLENRVRCNRCGGYLVKRKGPHGEFWGCSNYPYCTNTEGNNKGSIGFKS